MPERRFPICSIPTPPCIGRLKLLNRMVTSLTKDTPDHLQVVGPRFAGKTVLLSALIERLKVQERPYTAIFAWDLAHQNFDDDSHFIRDFAQQIAIALKAHHPEYADHLLSDSNPSTSDIAEVLEALKGDNGKVLAILDGFDKAASNGRLTRNLWDQLRELAIKPSLRLIISSRRRMSELIRDPNAAGSPFWNIFEPNPVSVGCFDELDIETILGCAPGLTLSVGAHSELLNATNAAPLLTLEVLNVLIESGQHGSVSAEVMLNTCQSTYPIVRDRLNLQWTDCPPTAQDLFRQVRSEGQVHDNPSWKADAEMLLERGFLQKSSNRLQRASRLLGRLIDETPNESSSLTRLFASSKAYEANLRFVFESRIAQIDRLDAILARFLKRGAEELPEYPEAFLSNIRGFVDRVFDLIWKAEIPDKRIPSGWMSIWKGNRERRVEEWETTFPQGVHRVRLLNLMTGTDRSAPCAQYVTKRTFVLMNGVHGFGDFGQHREGAPVDAGVGYAAMHMCIELASAVSIELHTLRPEFLGKA